MTTSVLRAGHLRKSYRGRCVVEDLSLQVESGEVVGLLGPNGAGKTTSFYMIVGLVSADAGTITLDDHDITGLPMHKRARLGLGYLPQEASVFRRLSVEDNIRAILETRRDLEKAARDEQLERILDELHIGHVRTSAGMALSGGERRRVEIARALAAAPRFMLLDEPFAGIDPIAVSEIQKIIFHLKERGIGVLVTDHNVRETLRITDRAYIVHDGVIFRSGTPASLAADDDVKRIYLGADFRLD